MPLPSDAADGSRERRHAFDSLESRKEPYSASKPQPSRWEHPAPNPGNCVSASHIAATRWLGLIGRAIRRYFVVSHMRLHFDQVVRIEIVILGQAVIVSSDALDGVGVVPERQHLEMRYLCLCAIQTPRPSVSARGPILGQRDAVYQIPVLIGFRNRNRSMPYPGGTILLLLRSRPRPSSRILAWPTHGGCNHIIYL